MTAEVLAVEIRFAGLRAHHHMCEKESDRGGGGLGA